MSDTATRRVVAILASVIGLALIVVGVVYLVENAHAIPSWLPGYTATATSHHHVKHGIAAILLGLAALTLAWFQLGPRRHGTRLAPLNRWPAYRAPS